MNTATLEADTRVLIDKSLENLGWILNGKKKNVFFEQPKTEKERKLLGGERPDYVLYSKDERGEDKAIMVIEAKRRGARVDTALEQGIRYAKQLDAPIVFATDGLFCKSYHTKFDRTPILNGEEVDEFLRETLAIKYLASWEVNTVSPKVQYDRKELIKIFDEANNMLRGDGLRAGIERFGEFANILFLKLISENERIKGESGKKTAFDDSCHWDIIKQIPKSGRLDYINQVYGKLNILYKTEIFTPLIIRSEDILKEIMDKLDPLTLTDVDSDVKGDAFEYFLKESAATKNDLGEYFTPRHIVKTMVKLVNPQIGEKIYDPFCGTGGFLIESFRHIWNTMPRNDKTIEMLKKETVYGNEITNTARITKMNMILAGDGHSNIHTKDSLAEPVDGSKGEGYDIVITNMPYSQKTKYGSLYDMPSNNGDSICVQHCMKAINSTAENGRMALVVPEGFLFRKDLSKTRELLLNNCDLQSVISLPQGVFLPYTGVKTNIIYATKVNQKIKTSQKRKDFWYFDVKSDGYTLDNHRRKLDSGSDLDKYQEYRKLDDDQRQDMLDVGFEVVPLDKVKDNSYILVGSRYREKETILSEYETVALNELFTAVSQIIDPQSGEGEVNYIGLENIETNTGALVGTIITKIKSIRSTKRAFCKGDILYGRLRPNLNKVCFAEFDGICSTDIIVLRPKSNNIIAKFYSIILRSKFFNDKVLNGVSGGQLPRVDANYLLSIPVVKVSVHEQQKLLEEIDSYQHIIDAAKTIVNNYKPIIRINEDWPKKKIGEICELSTGSTPSTQDRENYDGGVIKWLVSGDVHKEIIYDCDGRITEKGMSAARLKMHKNNSVLIALNGQGKTRGTVALLRTEATSNQSLVSMYPNPDEVIADYLYYVLKGMYQEIRDITGDKHRSGLNMIIIRDMLVPVPSLEAQKRILLQIEAEQALVTPSKELIEMFTKKIQSRIDEIWGE